MLFSWQIEAVKLIQKAWRKHRRTRRVIIFSHNILYFSYFICSPCSTSTFLITKTQKIDCKGREIFVFENTSCYTPRQSGFWVGCVDALKLPKRCEKVAAIRRWALWGGCSSWDEGIVGMWRLLKGNIYYEREKGTHETGLSGNVVASLFPSHNIYSALLQHIEHCSTRKSTCRLPIHIHIYIIYIYIYIYILWEEEDK